MFKKSSQHHIFKISTNDNGNVIERSDDDGFIENISKGDGRYENQANSAFVGASLSGTRFKWASAFIFSCIILLGLRVGTLQIVNGAELQARAEQNRFKEIIAPANRGIITDRNGLVLAENLAIFNIVLNPLQLPAEEESRSIALEQISSKMPESKEILTDYLEFDVKKLNPVLLLEDASYELAITLRADAEMYPGLSVETTSKRSYITYAIPSLSHILGYSGTVNAEEYEVVKQDGYRAFDQIGKQGIEKVYEKDLRGLFGRKIVEVTASGQQNQVISEEPTQDGEDLVLTIDAGLQSKIEEILQARMKGTPATKASVIVMKPDTGEVLSLVSWPGYDANLFPNKDGNAYAALLEDERAPLFPRATSGESPSGSTIKTVFAAAGLLEGIITPRTTIVSIGGIQVGPWFFPDWRPGGHGVTDVYHAIADSVNTYFYYLGAGYNEFEGLGIDRLMQYSSLFGFGSITGIDLPGEADGFLPSKEWKQQAKGERWYIGDTYNTSIGQGDLLVTPLQMARATSVFANNGVMVVPQLVFNGEVEEQRIIPKETSDIIKKAMRQTVTAGSAKSLQTAPVEVAGKTGTAQWSSTKSNHSWFTGFAPYDEPEVTITVLIEEGGDTALALPVTREIIQFWFASSP